MNILLAPMGTSGDVAPYVGLGRVLQARGHQVTAIVNPYFQTLIERAGLEFAPCGDADDYRAKLNHPDFWNPKQSVAFAFREMYLPAMRPLYHAIAARYEPGKTILAAPPLAIAARLAHDKLGVPLASILLQPAFIRSVVDDSEGFLLPRWAPASYRRLRFRVLDRWLDRFFAGPVNAFRAELGLAPIHRGFYEWFHSPRLQLGLFPDWFAERQPDWPAALRLTGFPLYDERGVESVPADAQEFLESGPPLLVFTFGTGMRQAREVFAESVAVCRTLDRRGILLTRFPEQLPPQLPDGVRHFDFLPFSYLLPRTAALIHHGGIGTLAQALAAGIPQLVVPFAYDQPDNAARLERLGVGRTLPPESYRASEAAAALRELLNSPAVAGRCQGFAQRLGATRPLGEAALALEELAATSLLG